MKRIIVLLTLSLLLISSGVFAAGTCTGADTEVKSSGHVRIRTVSCTADASAATFPATTISDVDGYLMLVVTDPGSTAPTDNYDITLVDSNNMDVMGDNLLNRDTSNSEQASPSETPRYVNGDLTMNITNNAVNSATLTVTLYIYMEN